jgi:hypothetical protein
MERKRTGKIKFVDFVNRNLGRSLSTKNIANKTHTHLRRVQMFCKSIRETKPTVVKWEGRKSISYTFRRNIRPEDICI